MSNPRMRRPPSMHFGVQDVVNGNRHRLILSGELDLVTAPELEAVILQICGDGKAVVLDLSRITSMDSCGLRLILLARSLCRECGSEFLVIPGEQNIDHLLEISGSAERIPLERLQSRSRQNGGSVMDVARTRLELGGGAPAAITANNRAARSARRTISYP
jgi:anti-anti-sigma factor